MVSSIQFGSKKIEFSLEFTKRKTLGISVTPDLDIIVKAPENTPIEKVKEKVKKRAPWIIKQQSYFLSFFPKTPPRKYINGETHLYLGKQYRLKVISGNDNSVNYKGRYFEVVANDSQLVKRLMHKWYKDRAKVKFAEIAEPLIQRFKKYGVEPTNLYLLDMPKRWGSCTPKGKIILNPELIKAPIGCIEYVILHELCHLIYHDHTARFLALQTKEMPDWENWKNKLETLLA